MVILLSTLYLLVWSSLVQRLQNKLSRIAFAWESAEEISKIQVENCFFIFIIQTEWTFKQRWLCGDMKV